MPITSTKNSTYNQKELRNKGYNVPQSAAERDTENNYECLISNDGYTWCKNVGPTSQPDPPQDNDTGINTFEEDVNLRNLDEDTKEKIARVWGITSDSFYKEIDGVRFYKTNKDKVYLGSYEANDLALIKDRKTGDEGTNQSTFTPAGLISMSESEMVAMLNRVNLIPESKSNMKKILKEEYQKRQTDKQIISKRFNIVSESKSAELIISEVNYLQKQKFSESLIKEGLFELIQAMYKDDADLVPKLKNSYKSWISKRLPNESELFKKSLEKSIDDLDDEKLPSLFTDCHQVVEMMYDAILSGMVNDRFDVVGVPKDIEDLLRREIIDNLKQDNMKLKIKAQLVNKICPQYGDLIRNTQKTFDDIKTKLLS